MTAPMYLAALRKAESMIVIDRLRILASSFETLRNQPRLAALDNYNSINSCLSSFVRPVERTA